MQDIYKTLQVLRIARVTSIIRQSQNLLLKQAKALATTNWWIVLLRSYIYMMLCFARADKWTFVKNEWAKRKTNSSEWSYKWFCIIDDTYVFDQQLSYKFKYHNSGRGHVKKLYLLNLSNYLYVTFRSVKLQSVGFYLVETLCSSKHRSDS